MSAPSSIPALILGLFWPGDAITQTAILLLLATALAAALVIYAPLLVRLFRIGQVQRSVQSCFDEEGSNTVQRQEVGNAFSESPLAYQWGDFVRRWQNAIAADPVQNASLPELSRAPVRLADVLQEHPLIQAGARRSLLPALPAIFLSAGLLGAFAGLVLALPGIGLSLDPPTYDATNRSRQIAELMNHIGMALRIGLWGLLLSLGAAITGRFIEGRAEALSETLDSWVQLAYGAISTGELATRTSHENRASLARLQEDVAELLRHASGRPRPLIRSTAAVPGAGTTASGESIDPARIERSVGALGDRLSAEMPGQIAGQITQQLERSVAEQLAALRESISGAAGSADGQPADAAGMADAVQQLARSSETQAAATDSLNRTARTVSEASEELRAGLDDFAGVVTEMRETSAALGLAAQRADTGQAPPRESAPLDFSGIEESVASLAYRLEAISETLEQLGEPDGATSPPPDPAALSRFASAAASAGSATASAPDPEPEQAEPEPRVEKRVEPREEPEEPRGTDSERKIAADPAPSSSASPPAPSSPPSPAPSSEADTIPNMPAPSPEMIYSARPADATAASAGVNEEDGAGESGGNLSGLLRATHHSGPSSPIPDPDDFDPAATVSLGRAATERLSIPDANDDEEPEGDDPDEEEEGSAQRGFFGRRK